LKIGFTKLDTPSSKLTELLSDESFVRWIKGKAAPEEQKKWDRWLQADDSRQLLVTRAQALYDLPFSRIEEQDTSFQRQRLQEKLRDNKKVKEKLPSIGRKRPSKQKWIPYAVAVGIILIFSLLFVLKTWNSSPHLKTIRTAYGQMDSVKIGVGSFIVLNANSTLRYNRAKTEKSDRRIILSGEAYFSIKHRPGRTLKIVTDDGIIKDVGTKFDVNTRNNKTRVALVEGQVKIISKDTSAAAQNSYVMHPGELATLSGSIKSITVQKKVDLNIYTSWIHNIMSFNHTPFKEIIKKIESTYGKKVIVKDPKLLNEEITGSIENANLDVLLDGLSQTLDVRMKQKDDRILVTRKSNH
jgi:ferric-dicitrate binding protein FerR (iron transport regulator)